MKKIKRKIHVIGLNSFKIKDLSLEVEELFQKVNSLAKKISHAIKKVVPCKRIGVSVIGLEVPHAHVHLVPINSISDLDFTKDRVKFSSEEFKELASDISANL